MGNKKAGVRANQSWTVVKVIKTDFRQDCCKKGKRSQYGTGLNSKNCKENSGFLIRGDDSGVEKEAGGGIENIRGKRDSA